MCVSLTLRQLRGRNQLPLLFISRNCYLETFCFVCLVFDIYEGIGILTHDIEDLISHSFV